MDNILGFMSYLYYSITVYKVTFFFLINYECSLKIGEFHKKSYLVEISVISEFLKTNILRVFET